ncbi:MAG: hypothetical protein JST39_25150, partial [Bacteroidetes bacterium]|nr:hypothetical protein [Bacteroidota bacterium]
GAGSAYEDYDAIHQLAYQQSDGVYAPGTANPAAGSVNSSALVGKYTRNAAAPYDVLFFTTAAIKDGESFKQGAKLFAMDVYTSAPVGTPISWQLESTAKSTASNYPKGRHSNYQGQVTQTNTWHTIYFYLQSIPDPSTYDSEVDRVTLLFAPNSSTGDVYYIDNLRCLNGSTSDSSNPVTPPTGLPSPWQNRDIGAVAAAGSAGFSNNIFTVKASGVDIWSAADEFHYVYQPFTGDGQIIARVDTLGNTNANAKACVMFRESLDSNAREVNTLVKAGGGTAISYRSATGGSTTSVNTSGNPPKWLKLTRAGNVFTASKSDDGVVWTTISTKTVTMASQVFIGFGATSHSDGVITTARFSNVSVSGNGARLAVGTDVVTPEIVKLYPNPAGNIVHLQWQGAAEQFTVYDMAGHAVLTGSLKTKQQA